MLCWFACLGQFTSRQRSNTEGSLRSAQPSPPQAAPLSPRLGPTTIQPSRSFSVEHQAALGSGSRLSDMIRRPSFARDESRNNKENLPSHGSQMELTSPQFSYAQSPPNMEGPVVFMVPELADEGLLNVEHRDTLGKLQFVSSLISSLIELAETKTSPLLESPNVNKLTGCVVIVSEKQRRIEQLVIYVRAMHVLSSSLQLAKVEVASGKLVPTKYVKTGK